MNRVIIFGPSGAGSTTIGKLLAGTLQVPHFDSDDYIWIPDETPFHRKRNCEQRQALLEDDLKNLEGWVLSGQVAGWGDFIVPLLELAVYVYVPAGIRMKRITEREKRRFGSDRIGPGGDLRKQYLKYLDWVASYEFGDFRMRSRASDDRWIEKLACPVFRPDASNVPETIIDSIVEELRAQRQRPNLDGTRGN